MPQLLFFVPCQRAIIDPQDKSLSLIAVIDGLQVQASPGTVPADAVVPTAWSAVASWIRTVGDAGKSFEQRISFITPDGRENVNGSIAFQMTERIQHNTTYLNAFPVAQAGEYRLRLSLRDVSEGDKWKTVTEYPIIIAHVGGQGG